MRIEQTAQPAEAATTIMQATIRMSCLVAAIGMGLPAGAAAQTEAPGAPADVRSEARSHLGPFYFTPGVRLKELGVDSNVFNAAGEQKSDFTFTLAPTLNVSVPFARRALLATTVGSDLVWYARYATERSVNPQVSVRGEVYLNRITLFGESAQAKHASAAELRNGWALAAGRGNGYGRNPGGAGVEVIRRGQRTPAARSATTTRRSSTATSLQRTLNRDSRGVQLTARHRVTPLTTLAAARPCRPGSIFRCRPIGIQTATRCCRASNSRRRRS